MAKTIFRKQPEACERDIKISKTSLSVSIISDSSEDFAPSLPSLSIKTYSFSPSAVYRKRRNVQAILCQAEALIAKELCVCVKDKR